MRPKKICQTPPAAAAKQFIFTSFLLIGLDKRRVNLPKTYYLWNIPRKNMGGR
jgi:hypothetical protein